MGRKRKPDDERKKPVSVSLSEKEIEQVKKVCDKSLSACIRRAVKEYLEKRR